MRLKTELPIRQFDGCCVPTMVIQAVFLEKVDDTKLVGNTREHPLNPEVEPLGVSRSIHVCLQDKLIFKLPTVGQ